MKMFDADKTRMVGLLCGKKSGNMKIRGGVGVINHLLNSEALHEGAAA